MIFGTEYSTILFLAIAVVMALPDFSFLMIATEMLLLDDGHYRSLAAFGISRDRAGVGSPRRRGGR